MREFTVVRNVSCETLHLVCSIVSLKRAFTHQTRHFYIARDSEASEREDTCFARALSWLLPLITSGSAAASSLARLSPRLAGRRTFLLLRRLPGSYILPREKGAVKKRKRRGVLNIDEKEGKGKRERELWLARYFIDPNPEPISNWPIVYGWRMARNPLRPHSDSCEKKKEKKKKKG